MVIACPVLAQPQIELPSDAEQPATALRRETPIENPLRQASVPLGSAIGGYGELTLNAPLGDGTPPSVIDLRRIVLFFGHNFSERIRFYSEVEVEHAVSSADDQGEVEIEQAYLDGLVSRRLNLRGGLILMPVGIINVYHEPPTFNGVDRPDVDTFVVPTTWREPGIGIFGEFADGLRYQLYLVNGLNANGFRAESAIREGHQEAQLARAGDFGGVGRLDYEPFAGTDFGVSVYGASSGNSLGAAVGRVFVTLFEADARTRRGGLTARAEVAFLFIGDAAALNRSLAAGSMEQMEAGPVSSQARGAYAEVGYDLLRLSPRPSEQSLTAFGRFDYTDTQADVPAGFLARPEFRRYTATLGVVWRPIPQIGIKLDYRRHELGAAPDSVVGASDGFNEIASAITWMF
jgi:hypothetical protein